MKLKEILKLIEANQMIVINRGPFAEVFKGLKKHINPYDAEFLEADAYIIYTDQDIYSQGYIKIRIQKEDIAKNESD